VRRYDNRPTYRVYEAEGDCERITYTVWIDKPIGKLKFGKFMGYESLLLTWVLENTYCEDGK
jgi:hypothetical protein